MEGAAEIEKGLTSIFQTRGKTARLRSLDVSVRASFVRTSRSRTSRTRCPVSLALADSHSLRIES